MDFNITGAVVDDFAVLEIMQTIWDKEDIFLTGTFAIYRLNKRQTKDQHYSTSIEEFLHDYFY